jgi:RNA polymerase sigma-70 factor, ECF subfamily
MQGRSSEDAGLAARARDGDVGAFEELVTRYQGIAFRVAWLVVRNRGDA